MLLFKRSSIFYILKKTKIEFFFTLVIAISISVSNRTVIKMPFQLCRLMYQPFWELPFRFCYHLNWVSPMTVGGKREKYGERLSMKAELLRCNCNLLSVVIMIPIVKQIVSFRHIALVLLSRTNIEGVRPLWII